MLKLILGKYRSTSLLRLNMYISKEKPSYDYQKAEEEAKNDRIKKNGKIIGNILNHIQSQQFRKNFHLKLYIHKHGWCCMHMWMLDYRARIFNCRWSQIPFSIIIRWMLKYLINFHNLKEMRSYTDRFDAQVYYQLRRINNVVYWSLDDYFVYNFRGKHLKQIFCEDLGLYADSSVLLSQQQEQNLVKIEEYLHQKINQMKQIPLLELVWRDFKWRL